MVGEAGDFAFTQLPGIRRGVADALALAAGAKSRIDDLASTDSGKGASLVGTESGDTVQAVMNFLRQPALNFASQRPDATGTLDCGPKLKAAISLAASLNIQKVYVPRGRYFFRITGDADTIQIPDYMHIECDDGAVFVWNYWGSPLFSMVNRTNVGISGATFEWGGTFGTTSGSRDAFSYGAAIPAYEWCTHIAAPGADNLTLENLKCLGTTTSNRLNSLALIKPKSDMATAVRNIRVRKIVVNDVSQGFLAGGMRDFLFEDIISDRYANDSAGLYGPGHLIYFIENGVASSFGLVRKIRDYATTQLSSYSSGAHTLSVKNVTDTRFEDVFSARPEGALNMWKTQRNYYDVRYNSSDTTSDSSFGIIYFSGTTSNFNYDNAFSCDITIADNRDVPAINQSGVVFGSQIARMTGKVVVRHSPTGAQTSQVNYLTCSDSNLSIEIITKSANKKADIVFYNEATVRRNNIMLKVTGIDAASSSPRVLFNSSCVNNKVSFEPCALFDYDRNSDFADANGNSVALSYDNEIISSKTAIAGTSPSFTVQLPKKGCYALDVTVVSSDGNSGLNGLYRIIWDSGNATNYAAAQLVGSTTQKGTAITALNVSVNASGVVTLASTTTGSDTFSARIGLRRSAGL